MRAMLFHALTRIGRSRDTLVTCWREFSTAIGRRLWVVSYDLEDARLRHAENGNQLRALGCAAALAILRLVA